MHLHTVYDWEWYMYFEKGGWTLQFENCLALLISQQDIKNIKFSIPFLKTL